jgi:hypothetical protein
VRENLIAAGNGESRRVACSRHSGKVAHFPHCAHRIPPHNGETRAARSAIAMIVLEGRCFALVEERRRTVGEVLAHDTSSEALNEAMNWWCYIHVWNPLLTLPSAMVRQMTVAAGIWWLRRMYDGEEARQNVEQSDAD